MAHTATVLLVGIAPWVLGITMLYGLLYRPGTWRLEHHLFVIGSAAYMGYLWLALLMAGLQSYRLPIFSKWLLTWMMLSIVVCWGLGTLTRLKLARTTTKTLDQKSSPVEQQGPSWLIAGLCIWLLIITASVCWEVALRPAVAWDTLRFWADEGHRFLLGQIATQDLTSMSSWTHPVTIKYLGAWGAFISYQNSTSHLYLPWTALYLGTVLATIATGRLLSGYWWLGLTVALLIASSPLIQAHASLGGYADLWVGAGLFLCLAWLAVATTKRMQSNAGLFIIIGLLIISLAFLKGNTVAYSIILLSAMLFSWAWIRRQWLALLGLIAAGVIAVLWVWNNGIDWSFSDYRLTFLVEERRIALGQRQARLSSNSWVEIGTNFGYAWAHSTSFYLAGLLGPMVCIVVAIRKALWQDFTVISSILLIIGLTLFFALGQYLNTQQLFAYATPESDSSFSRFSIVLYFALAFSFVSLSQTFNSRR